MVSSSKMLSTTKLAKGPCGGKCYVTAMEATIRYPGGAEANVDTGSWMHHIALFGSGAGGGSIWAAGNERPTLRLNEQKKFGLDFPSNFMLIVDMMVEDTKAKNLTLEITYEHVPKTGSGYGAARMYWLTIGEPAAKTGKYSFTTRAMTAKAGGSLLYAIGHMHDGGTDMQLFVGNRMVCKSIMHYSGAPKQAEGASMDGMAGMSHGSTGGSHGHKTRGLSKRDGGGHGGHGGSHISAPGACTDFGSVKSGDSMKAVANYDATKHVLMEMNGKKEKLMGYVYLLVLLDMLRIRILTVLQQHACLCWSWFRLSLLPCNILNIPFASRCTIPTIKTSMTSLFDMLSMNVPELAFFLF
jgi:hypothetical protein